LISDFGLCRVIQSCLATAIAVGSPLFSARRFHDYAQDQAGDRFMRWGNISKGKICGVFSLKALALAFFLTPMTVAAPPLATPAAAQFVIGIPGIRFYGYGGGRHYHGGGGGYHHSRHHRGGGGGGGGDESNAAPSSPAPGKGVRGTTD
jgi:hypothetical protein